MRYELAHNLHHGGQSFFGPYSFSASQEIPRILWNTKVHYRIHKCPTPIPLPSQINPVHAPPHPHQFHFQKMSSYCFPVYAWVFQVVSFPHDSPPKLCMQLSPICSTCPAHPILLDLIFRIFAEECSSPRPSLYSFLHSRVTSSLLV
jgi:hypothetical protein